MRRGQAAALAFCAVLVLLGIFQLALVAGAPLGAFAWGGQAEVLPTALWISSFVAVGLYGLFALIVLDRAGVIAILPGRRTAKIAAWVLVAYLLLGTVMNAMSQSLPERMTMTPVSLLLGVLAVVVALA